MKTLLTLTLRIYDSVFSLNLNELAEKEKNNYRNMNDFYTMLIKLGYEVFISNKGGGNNKSEIFIEFPGDEINQVYPLLCELINYQMAQFKNISLNNRLLQKLASSVYNIVLSLNSEEKLMPQKLEDGFYDDLPPRFEKAILSLGTDYGIS